MIIQVRLAKSLTSLTLSHNALTQVPYQHLISPQTTSPLATPHLVSSKASSSNLWTQVEQLTGLPSLSSLHLAHNNLKQLPELHTRLGQVNLDLDSRFPSFFCTILRLQPSIYRTTAFATYTDLPSGTTLLSKINQILFPLNASDSKCRCYSLSILLAGSNKLRTLADVSPATSLPCITNLQVPFQYICIDQLLKSPAGA